MALKEQIKEIKEKFQNINKVKLNDGSVLAFKVAPKFNPNQTKLGITFTKDITEDDVEIIIKVNGEVNTFISGINDSKFSCEASFTKRF